MEIAPPTTYSTDFKLIRFDGGAFFYSILSDNKPWIIPTRLITPSNQAG